MIYICSDIHGLYHRYAKLLETISLRDTDTLYVLGDMIDRGPDGIQILQDMMNHKNIIPFMGNHEHMMLMYLEGLDTVSWTMFSNGGITTKVRFSRLPKARQNEILDYLEHSWVVKNLTIAGQRYSLSHIGIFSDNRDRRAEFHSPNTDVHDLQDMVWGEYPYGLNAIGYYPETLCPTTFISGHKFTRRWRGYLEDDTVYIKEYENGCRYIDIDCGCALGNGEGYLACLVIDEDKGFDPDQILYIR